MLPLLLRNFMIAKGLRYHNNKVTSLWRFADSEKGPVVSTNVVSSLEEIQITRLPTEDDSEPSLGTERRSTFHIYQKHECHKSISPTTDPLKERRSGPTVKQQKAKRKEKKERVDSGLPRIDPDENAFFLHRPYLAFHVPPRVL
jgi:hypothetical protein